MQNIFEMLSRGARHQEAGQLTEAERAYRLVLQADPDNAQAIHLLGTLALQAGNLPQAIQIIGDAIRRDRSQASFHANLAEAHRLSGNLEQAIACNKMALKLQPDLANAYRNLGQIYNEQDNYQGLADSQRQVTRLAPDDVQARLLLGHALKELGKPAEAEACYRRVLRTAPNNRRATTMLGLVLQDQRKLAEALVYLQQAHTLDPNHAGVNTNLGNLLKEMLRTAEAEQYFRRAIELDPNLAVAHNNLGAVLLDAGQYEESIAELTLACKLDPAAAASACNLARALEETGRLDEALVAARRALELAPNFAYAHGNTGTTLRTLGRLDEAIASYRRACAADPTADFLRSNLVYTLNYHPDYDAATIHAEHLEWGRVLADPHTAAAPPHTNDRTPQRRLRLGYVSAHFWGHAVNFFTEPILASHDHAAFEVFCYYNRGSSDETTAQLRKYADGWREINALGDDRISQMIRDDKIDILVDLSGHIAGNRLLTFARKPAPVQVTYIGYQNTTGLAAMDYRLTDAWADPPGTNDELYTEKLVRLPRSFFCYQPSADAPPVAPLPAAANGYVTFASFNHFAKVTPQVLATWATLLRAVPDSRLTILCSLVPSLREYLVSAMSGHGIRPDRLTLADRRTRNKYLELINRTDIALDPFPFNGHTTTCDALWQGVPVVTLAGSTYAQRFGSSAHVNLGLEELVARSPQQYVEIAAGLANHLDRLSTLRATLRPRMAASPLLDFAGFTRNLETAYREMWREWCRRGSPT
jgi:protein O-GlcNAc transferase